MRVQWLKQLDAGGGIEACPRSWPGCGLDSTPEGKHQIGAWLGRHYGCAGSVGDKTGGRKRWRQKLLKGDRLLAHTWA